MNITHTKQPMMMNPAKSKHVIDATLGTGSGSANSRPAPSRRSDPMSRARAARTASRVVDPRQDARLERFRFALGGYLICLLVALACVPAGYVRLADLARAVPAVVLANLAIYVVFRTRLNMHLDDPNLATIQMLIATGFTMYAAFIAGEARPLFLMLYLVPYIYATSQLRPKKHLLLGAFGLALYATLVVVHRLAAPETANLSFELLQIATFAIVMVWLSFVGHSHKLLRYRAEYDQLTRVRNRQNLLEQLDHEAQRANRGGPSFCVALLDIDHFKRINDAFGHTAGDRVLMRFAKAMLRSRRRTDVVGRFGGEEFLVLLPGTRLQHSVMPLERLRMHVASMPLDNVNKGLRITVSIGVAEFVPGESVADLIARVDRKLYEAKTLGRNRIVIDRA